ncbi:hypothetical protein [Glutamicibacter ardleyensis]|uniref:Uncharacterized protein n=1 Tax=Glutamicibacter ardleyensis TaxID=225894 RepID=A0ABQ2DY04_9MICC|nr:hypothetical protein [Glutamicibacter ardleyensis]GGJ74512.1 hypothetical protein GCM10007173_36870 [Glutamicibacter ardleyensis]
MLQFTVDLHDFRSALASTKTHVSSDRDDEIGRSLDCTIRPNRELLVTASNGLTVGIARASIDEAGFNGELGQFSMTPEIAGTIIDMFAPGKEDWNVQLEVTVTFVQEQRIGEEDITVATIKVRRLGQLFGGDQLSVTTPVQVRGDRERLWATVARSAQRSRAMLPPTRFDLKRLSAFRAAQTTYGEPLTIAALVHDFGSLIVFCGHNFVGIVTADRVELENKDKDNYEDLKEHWANELPSPIAFVS